MKYSVSVLVAWEMDKHALSEAAEERDTWLVLGLVM